MPRTNVTDQELLAFAAGEADPDAAAKVRAHIAENADAARMVELYRLARARIAEDDSVAPPPSVIARAKSIFETLPREATPTLLDRLDAIVAELIYDSRLQPASVRYADTRSRFQLSYEAAGMDVDLQAERIDDDDESAGRWRLMGQLGSDRRLSEIRIDLLRPDTEEPVASTEADEHAIFNVDLESGMYVLHITLPDCVILLEGIELE